MTALLLIKGDQRNLKKVTDTGVGAGDKEESLVKLSRVEFDQNFLLFNIESVRFPPQSPVAVFLLPPPENLSLLLSLRVASFFTLLNLLVVKNFCQEYHFQLSNSILSTSLGFSEINE